MDRDELAALTTTVQFLARLAATAPKVAEPGKIDGTKCHVCGWWNGTHAPSCRFTEFPPSTAPQSPPAAPVWECPSCDFACASNEHPNDVCHSDCQSTSWSHATPRCIIVPKRAPVARVMSIEELLRDRLEFAWTILCNVSGGDWQMQTKDWQTAVGKFRDDYHALPKVTR